MLRKTGLWHFTNIAEHVLEIKNIADRLDSEVLLYGIYFFFGSVEKLQEMCTHFHGSLWLRWVEFIYEKIHVMIFKSSTSSSPGITSWFIYILVEHINSKKAFL